MLTISQLSNEPQVGWRASEQAFTPRRRPSFPPPLSSLDRSQTPRALSTCIFPQPTPWLVLLTMADSIERGLLRSLSNYPARDETVHIGTTFTGACAHHLSPDLIRLRSTYTRGAVHFRPCWQHHSCSLTSNRLCDARSSRLPNLTCRHCLTMPLHTTSTTLTLYPSFSTPQTPQRS